MKFLYSVLLSIAIMGVSTIVSAGETQHVYFIGNSLTGSLTPDRVHRLFEQRGIDFQFGAQFSGGKSLIRHLNYRKEPKQKWIWWETNAKRGDTYEPDLNPYSKEAPRFGLYDNALAKHKWDAVVMQPWFRNNLHDDFEAISAFIDICLKSKTASRFYVYGTWPIRRKKRTADGKVVPMNLDYQKAWLAQYSASVTDTGKASYRNTATRSYYNTLVSELNKKYSKLSDPIRLISVGEVLFELDKMIRAGKLPGLEALAKRDKSMLPGLGSNTSFKDGINVLYADTIHLNPIPHKGNSLGIFVSGSSIHAALAGKSPVGLSGKDYGLDDTKDVELAKTIQETIWKVVSKGLK